MLSKDCDVAMTVKAAEAVVSLSREASLGIDVMQVLAVDKYLKAHTVAGVQ